MKRLIYCLAQLRLVRMNIRLIGGDAVTAVFAASPFSGAVKSEAIREN